MKLIHMADLHLGSALSDLPTEKRNIRAAEISSSLSRAAEYARKNKIGVIMLSGDVFDAPRPRRSERELFYGVIEENPDVDFLYLRGNHDTEESFLRGDIKNLKTFGADWTTYDYGDVIVCGAENSGGRAPSFYSALNLPADKFNIVMLHGVISPLKSVKVDEISLPLLRGKNIDYLALGHIHGYTSGVIDGRGAYAYSGCPEGRGFDETGDKGFVVVDTSARRFTFIKSAVRDVVIRSADMSSLSGAGEVLAAVKKSLSGVDGKNIVRVELCGKTRLDISSLVLSVKNYFSGGYFSFDVKDKTRRIFGGEDLALSASLKGEFYRAVISDGNLSDEEKEDVLALGLKALDGEEV